MLCVCVCVCVFVVKFFIVHKTENNVSHPLRFRKSFKRLGKTQTSSHRDEGDETSLKKENATKRECSPLCQSMCIYI